MSKIKTARTLLRRAVGLLESGEVEWIQGALGEKDGVRLDTFNPREKGFRGEKYELVPANKVHAACLMGVIDIAAARFVKPELIDKTVHEAFELLAKEIVRWDESTETLKQEYREYVESTKEYNRDSAYQEEILSFDEWQMEELLNEVGDPEDTIADFNDYYQTTRKDALATLRRAARLN